MRNARFVAVFLAALLASSTLMAQLPQISWPQVPQMPHLPEPNLRVPEIRIPPIQVPIGHKTNKWEIRHNLEKDGWWVAYGKEIGYQEYYDFGQAVAASVATENPGPAMEYLKVLLVESIEVLSNNAGREFGNRLRDIAERELISVFYDAVKNGRVRNIAVKGIEVQLGMATYNREESGVPLPNTFQPYLRMRLTLDSGGADGHPTRYLWVTTIYNPTDVAVNYGFYDGDVWKQYSVPARGWRWHSRDSANSPEFKIDFDMGPPAQHEHKKYDLNHHRLFIGTAPSDSKGEPYTFRFNSQKGWDLYRGRP